MDEEDEIDDECIPRYEMEGWSEPDHDLDKDNGLKTSNDSKVTLKLEEKRRNVLGLRHRLQKGFLTPGIPPRGSEMDIYLRALEDKAEFLLCAETIEVSFNHRSNKFSNVTKN
jgi:hypothetical protein